MDLYAENILEHYRAPRGKLPLPAIRPPVQGPSTPQGLERRAHGREAGEGWDEGLTTHTESNPACGDEITVRLTTRDNHIVTLHWDGIGCAISQAAMSMLTEKFEGKPAEIIDNFTKEDMLTLLGVPIGPRRLKCALLGLHACKNSLQKEQKKEIRGWTQSVL